MIKRTVIKVMGGRTNDRRVRYLVQVWCLIKMGNNVVLSEELTWVFRDFTNNFFLYFVFPLIFIYTDRQLLFRRYGHKLIQATRKYNINKQDTVINLIREVSQPPNKSNNFVCLPVWRRKYGSIHDTIIN